MPLHLDYRPKNLLEFVGNEATKEALKSVLGREDHPRVLLFAGPRGCGKTTLARIVAKELGCSEMSTHELNISNTRGIDYARQLEKAMRHRPIDANVKAFILDECQSATSEFQDSVLKPLEDTPEHVVVILCTTEPQKLKKTVLSRCTKFEVKPLRAMEIRQLLNHVLTFEGVKNFPAEAIEKISQACEGVPREALVLLDKVIDITDDALLLETLDQDGGSLYCRPCRNC